MTDPTEFIKDFEKFLAEPTDEELNKRMHEIMGLCFHVQEPDGRPLFCQKCHRFIIKHDFTVDWSAFGIAWEWIQNHPGWYSFWHKYWHTNLISPLKLAEAIVEFFKEETGC